MGEVCLHEGFVRRFRNSVSLVPAPTRLFSFSGPPWTTEQGRKGAFEMTSEKKDLSGDLTPRPPGQGAGARPRDKPFIPAVVIGAGSPDQLGPSKSEPFSRPLQATATNPMAACGPDGTLRPPKRLGLCYPETWHLVSVPYPVTWHLVGRT